MKLLVPSSWTDQRLASSEAAPAPRTARVRPTSSSPGARLLTPVSQAERVTNVAPRLSSARSATLSHPSAGLKWGQELLPHRGEHPVEAGPQRVQIGFEVCSAIDALA